MADGEMRGKMESRIWIYISLLCGRWMLDLVDAFLALDILKHILARDTQLVY